MSPQTRWKLLALLIVASTIIGAVGWQQFTPKPMSPTTIMVTPAATTVIGSQTTVIPQRRAEWIRVGEVKQIDHYVSLLQSNGTAPYVHLALELCKLPELTNATAVAKITYLALNASNPEVKEALTLMINGGTPDPRDYLYKVPSWNTELQVLYWLACQNEFKRDDTLALAIAMVNGFWVTIGDSNVKEALQQDLNGLLGFFRETNQMQKEKGYYELEDYPLEAKVCLAWTASITPNLSALPLVWGSGYVDRRAYGYFANGTRVTLEGYRWNTVSLATLRAMRELMSRNGWMKKDPSDTIPFLEEYFYFSNRHLQGHWEKEPAFIMVDGRWVHDYTIGNVNWQLNFYLQTEKFQGQCTDESQWIDAWAKSWGIATTTIWRGWLDPEGKVPPRLFYAQHFHPIFYDPSSRSWKASRIQLSVSSEVADEPLFFMIFRPPFDLSKYFSSKARTSYYPRVDWLYGNNPNMFHWYPHLITLKEIAAMFLSGLPTSEIQWLLYS